MPRQRLPKRRVLSREQEREIEANLFAIYLLLPADDLRRDADYLRPEGFDIVEDSAIQALAVKYRVSEQLMLLRLVQLGYFEGILHAPYEQ